MPLTPAPEKVEAAFVLPGHAWSSETVMSTCDWMFDGANLRYLTLTAAYVLGRRRIGNRATNELARDAEDACQDFAIGRFVRVVRQWNPERGAFAPFFMFCFRRWCKARARKLASRIRREQPIATVGFQIASPEPSIEMRLVKRVDRLDTRRVICRAMCARLSRPARKVLVLEHWGDVPLKERAAAIGKTVGTTKVTARRARERLARCLRPYASAAHGFREIAK